MNLLEKIIEIIKLELNSPELTLENLEHAKVLLEKAIEAGKSKVQ